MYIIGVYDIKEERVNKVRKVFDKYLNRCQNSVYVGDLSVGQLKEFKNELMKIVVKDEDSIIFFTTRNEKYLKKEVLGVEKYLDDVFI